jgi:hypothetical protein
MEEIIANFIKEEQEKTLNVRIVGVKEEEKKEILEVISEFFVRIFRHT